MIMKFLLLLLAAIWASAGVADSEPTKESEQPSVNCYQPTLVEMTRHALQFAYAPQRLIKRSDCITPIAHAGRALDLMRCRAETPICGGGVVATPIAAWRGGKYYLNLIEIENRLEREVLLDPRDVVGQFRAAAFAHHTLGPARTGLASLTSLVVISERPLMEAVQRSQWLGESYEP